MRGGGAGISGVLRQLYQSSLFRVVGSILGESIVFQSENSLPTELDFTPTVEGDGTLQTNVMEQSTFVPEVDGSRIDRDSIFLFAENNVSLAALSRSLCSKTREME